jgi:hypothetical protein
MWAHDNGIIINLAKTKCMHMYSPYNRRAKSINYDEYGVVGHSYECLHNCKHNCTCEPLEYVNSYKYLGLIVDNNFNWKTHVSAVGTKLRSVLSKFYHLNSVVSKKTMLVVYYSLADSVLNYGLHVYGRTFQTYLHNIKNIQTRFIKFLVSKKNKIKCKGNYDELYKICKILPIHLRVQYLIALDNYYNSEYKIRKQNKYNTRNVRLKKLVQHCVKNYYGKRTNKYMVPKLCNEIEWLREEKQCSRNVAKSTLKNIFLDKLP